MNVPSEEGAWLRNAVMVDSPKEVAKVEVDSQMEEAEAAVYQMILEVRLWRLAEEAGARDLTGKMWQT